MGVLSNFPREQSEPSMKTSTANFHSEWMRKVKTMSVASLRYTANDCKEAIEANPENPKNGEYADIISYCGMEIK